jgi:hypothetical protein
MLKSVALTVKNEPETERGSQKENALNRLRADHPKIDTILALRGNALPKELPSDKKSLACEIEVDLLACKWEAERGTRAYSALAKSFSRLIAKYYFEDGNSACSKTPEFKELISHLGEYLHAELDMALDMDIPKSLIGKGLAKFSISEISDMHNYLKDIAANGNDVVASNIPTIINTVFSRSNSNRDLLRHLAEGAQKIRDDIAKKYDGVKLVKGHIPTLIYAALSRGDPSLAYRLAKSIEDTQEWVAENYNGDEVVMDFFYTKLKDAIIFSFGSLKALNAVYDLAIGVKEALMAIAEKYARFAVVMDNLSTITYATLDKGDPSFASILADGVLEVLDKILGEYSGNPLVMAYLPTIINVALNIGDPIRAYDLASEINRGTANVRQLLRRANNTHITNAA